MYLFSFLCSPGSAGKLDLILKQSKHNKHTNKQTNKQTNNNLILVILLVSNVKEGKLVDAAYNMEHSVKNCTLKFGDKVFLTKRISTCFAPGKPNELYRDVKEGTATYIEGFTKATNKDKLQAICSFHKDIDGISYKTTLAIKIQNLSTDFDSAREAAGASGSASKPKVQDCDETDETPELQPLPGFPFLVPDFEDQELKVVSGWEKNLREADEKSKVDGLAREKKTTTKTQTNCET